MTTYTSRNVPLIEASDTADIAARVNPVAQLQHDRPGVAALTTTQRNALTGAELWDGRLVLNTTTDRLNRYDLGTTSWIVIPDNGDIAALLATTGTPAALGTASRGVSTSAARADHIHPEPTAVMDTGLRDITALADAAFRSAFPASRVYVRRLGNTVWVWVYMHTPTAGSSVTVMSAATAVFPAGFRAPTLLDSSGTRRQAPGLTFNNSNGAIGGAQLLVTNSTFATDLALYGMTSGVTCHTVITFPTTEAWPGTLPGIAATG